MLKVLHGPVNVGNQPWVLSRAERSLGLDSELVVNYDTWLKYNADRCLSRCGNRWPLAKFRRLKFGLTAPFRYDVFHYYFGRTHLCWDDYGPRNLLWFRDLDLAKRLGKNVFMTLQGCDVRLSDESSRLNEFTPCHVGECRAAETCRSSLDAQRRNLIDKVLPKVDRVFVLNPELARFVPGAEFLPYAGADLHSVSPVYPKNDGRFRIVHAPSDEGTKGTRYIRATIEALQRDFPIDFRLVQGLPHAEALKLYREADLIIDQVLYGWYGIFAVEAMALGKPVVCYIREEDRPFVPADFWDDLPLLNVRPDRLEQDLGAILEKRSVWGDWGRRARDFVLRRHDPACIARALIEVYRDPSSPLQFTTTLLQKAA